MLKNIKKIFFSNENVEIKEKFIGKYFKLIRKLKKFFKSTNGNFEIKI